MRCAARRRHRLAPACRLPAAHWPAAHRRGPAERSRPAKRPDAGLAGLEERSSVSTWRYRIATSRCLSALRHSGRHQPPPVPPFEPPQPTSWGEPIWLEPYPDALLEGIVDIAPGPEARYQATE